MKIFLAILFLDLAGLCRAGVTFGLTADIQYADQDAAIGREYRASLGKLQTCVAAWNRAPLDFVIQLGDVVDAGVQSFDPVFTIFAGLRAPLYHVPGNHDFTGGRDVLLKRLGLQRAYYDFRRPGWRFVVMDGMNVSTGSEAGRERLAALTREKAPNAQPWNGAAGREQLEWLRGVLTDAERRKERVIIFSHFPALAESCRPNHLLWDHAELLRILEASPAVAAYFNGHDHRGGFAESAGIPFVTFPALVEHQPEDACSIVDLEGGQITIRSISGSVRQALRTAPRD